MKRSIMEHNNSSSRRQSVTKHASNNSNSQQMSKQEVAKKGSDLYWGAVSAKPFNDLRFQCEGTEEENLSMMLGDENEYLCSECRSSKVGSHLMTLKKLREKALKYTTQLDEIRSATKKREKELTDVMERLQQEEKNLHAQLENVDQLSFKMNMRRNQLRQDQIALQHEESSMAERLQTLKEKEIFVNCQMVKLQSQEAAIKHRRKELNKEKLRIEKLAYLIFKTDLSTMTYKEFHTRIGKMQNNLEKKFRKMKVLEHYCQHKNLEGLKGLNLEPLTPIEHLDPALNAFKEAIWNRKCSELLNSNGSSMKLFGDDSQMSSFNYNCKSGLDETLLEKYTKKRPKETESVLKTSYKSKALAKDGRLSFFQSQQSSFTTTIYETDSEVSHPVNSNSSNSETHHHDSTSNKNQDNSNSNSNSNTNNDNDISQEGIGSESKQSTDIYPTATKKSKSEQEKIVKEASNNVQRLVCSAKDVCASAHRLLQTPLSFDHHNNKRSKSHHLKRKRHSLHGRQKKNGEETGNDKNCNIDKDQEENGAENINSESGSSQPDEDFVQEDFEQELQHRENQSGETEVDNDQDHENDNEDEDSDSFLSDISQINEEMQDPSSNNNSEGDEDENAEDEVLEETEIIHKRISKLENSSFRKPSARLSINVSGDFTEVGSVSDQFNNLGSSNSQTNFNSNSEATNFDSNCHSDSNDNTHWTTIKNPKPKPHKNSTDPPVVDENGEIKICSIFRNSKNDEDKVSSQSLIHPEPCNHKSAVPFKCRWKQSEESIKEDDEDVQEVVEKDCRHEHHEHQHHHHNGQKKHSIRTPSVNREQRANGSRSRNQNSQQGQHQRYHSPNSNNKNTKHHHQQNQPHTQSQHQPEEEYHEPNENQNQILPEDSSSQNFLEDSCESNNRFDHYDEIVKDRLSRLSETTRNEIVYAIGQKALAQVAQAMDKVTSSRMEGIENAPSKHGDQKQMNIRGGGGGMSGLGFLPIQNSYTNNEHISTGSENLSNDNNNSNLHNNNFHNKNSSCTFNNINNPNNNNNNNHPNTSCTNNCLALTQRNPRTPDHSTYLAMVRRGMRTPSTKGPRKIPSHLKFGNFNIRHRNRKTGNTYRNNPNVNVSINPSQQIPQNMYHNHNNIVAQNSLVPLQNHNHNNNQQQQQHHHQLQNLDHHHHHEGSSPYSVVDSKPSKTLSNKNNDSNSQFPCEDFPHSNYTVGLVAEKILGIHTLANPNKRRRDNHSLVNKLSHHRAFRV